MCTVLVSESGFLVYLKLASLDGVCEKLVFSAGRIVPNVC